MHDPADDAAYWQADSDARADDDFLQRLVAEAGREAAAFRAGEAARAKEQPETW